MIHPRKRIAFLSAAAAAVLAALGLSCSPGGSVIAHRGASKYAPENTWASFWLARALGADFLEADLQLTRDGRIIVLHDDTLDRTTDVLAQYPKQARAAAPRTWKWARIQTLDAGHWFNQAFPERARPSFKGSLKVLSLEELIAIAEGNDDSANQSSPGANAQGCGLYLETKSPENSPGIEEKLVALLKAKHWITPDGQVAPGRRLVFQSFQEQSLRKLSALAPGVPRTLLVGQNPDWSAAQSDIARAAHLGQAIAPHGLVTHRFAGISGLALSHEAHRQGLAVHPWVLNQPWQLRVWRLFGADAVFSDAPDTALRALGRTPGRALPALLTELDRKLAGLSSQGP